MESPENPSKQLGQQKIEADKQLPSGNNSVDRFTQHATGLVEDIKEWVDLKVQLFQLEIETKIDRKVNRIILGVILAFLAFMVFLFGLIALSFGLGAWLGHPGWGFLAVTVMLIIITGLMYLFKPRWTGMIVQKRMDEVFQDDETD